MPSKRGLFLLAVLLCIIQTTGCSTTLPIESPICVPEREFVLADISVQDQLSIREISDDLLLRIAQNDATLKNHVSLLEKLIEAHDEPLGDCE